MKRARRMGLHPRHDLSNPTRRCVEATIRQGLSRITAPRRPWECLPSQEKQKASRPNSNSRLCFCVASCRACNFDFHEQYGDVGKGFIECHHVLPLSVAQQSKPKLVDIALLCSNCHRMVHRRRPWLEMDQLTSLLGVGV